MRLHLASIVRAASCAGVLAAWSAVAAAQTPVPLPGAVAPLPPIGLPLPPIGLPLPQIGLPPAVDPRAVVHPGRIPDPIRRGFPRSHRHTGGEVVYVVPAYGWPFPYVAGVPVPGVPSVSSKGVPETKLPKGRVRLDITPAAVLQLYVDGYFVGTSLDLDDELRLEAGPHKIEIHAAGFETLVVDVNIAPRRSITYRAALTRSGAKAPQDTPVADAANATPATPATPMLVYVIPGCYVGNVPPEDARLPPTCDVSRAITRER